ncbi:MAG: hypothetical protein ACE5K0_07255, partial [Candidatus Methanofastidiosia archaeon]
GDMDYEKGHAERQKDFDIAFEVAPEVLPNDIDVNLTLSKYQAELGEKIYAYTSGIIHVKECLKWLKVGAVGSAPRCLNWNEYDVVATPNNTNTYFNVEGLDIESYLDMDNNQWFIEIDTDYVYNAPIINNLSGSPFYCSVAGGECKSDCEAGEFYFSSHQCPGTKCCSSDELHNVVDLYSSLALSAVVWDPQNQSIDVKMVNTQDPDEVLCNANCQPTCLEQECSQTGQECHERCVGSGELADCFTVCEDVCVQYSCVKSGYACSCSYYADEPGRMYYHAVATDSDMYEYSSPWDDFFVDEIKVENFVEEQVCTGKINPKYERTEFSALVRDLDDSPVNVSICDDKDCSTVFCDMTCSGDSWLTGKQCSCSYTFAGETGYKIVATNEKNITDATKGGTGTTDCPEEEEEPGPIRGEQAGYDVIQPVKKFVQ